MNAWIYVYQFISRDLITSFSHFLSGWKAALLWESKKATKSVCMSEHAAKETRIERKKERKKCGHHYRLIRSDPSMSCIFFHSFFIPLWKLLCFWCAFLIKWLWSHVPTACITQLERTELTHYMHLNSNGMRSDPTKQTNLFRKGRGKKMNTNASQSISSDSARYAYATIWLICIMYTQCTRSQWSSDRVREPNKMGNMPNTNEAHERTLCCRTCIWYEIRDDGNEVDDKDRPRKRTKPRKEMKRKKKKKEKLRMIAHAQSPLFIPNVLHLSHIIKSVYTRLPVTRR